MTESRKKDAEQEESDRRKKHYKVIKLESLESRKMYGSVQEQKSQCE